jgi:hypothetical protein
MTVVNLAERRKIDLRLSPAAHAAVCALADALALPRNALMTVGVVMVCARMAPAVLRGEEKAKLRETLRKEFQTLLAKLSD